MSSEPEKKRTRVSCETTLVPMEDMDDDDLIELFSICRSPSLMFYIGESEPWSLEYIVQLRKWAKKDAAEPSPRDYFSWGVAEVIPMSDRKPPANADPAEFAPRTRRIVGYLGLRPTKDRAMPGLQIRIVIAKEYQGKGHARRAIMQSADIYFKDRSERPCSLWSVVHKENKASQALFAKCGFVKCGEKLFKSSPIPEDVYRLDLPIKKD